MFQNRNILILKFRVRRLQNAFNILLFILKWVFKEMHAVFSELGLPQNLGFEFSVQSEHPDTHVFISPSKDKSVISWVPNETPLEKGDVKYGRVEIDELKDEHFESQVVVELRLRPVHL